MPRKKAVIEPPAQQIPAIEEDAPTTLDFEDSPAPVKEVGSVQHAFSSLKGMLGIKDTPEGEKKPAPIFSAKLNKKQQSFVDACTPTLALAFMSLSGYLWGRISAEYGATLAATDEVAQRIVEPLLRIYARHNEFLIEMHPDIADALVSLSAVGAYVHASMGMYQQIKREKEAYEQGYEAQDNVSSIRGRTPAALTSENGASDAGNRSAPIQRRSRENVEPAGVNGRTTGNFNSNDLSDKEARQHAALSRLSELDYNHRARRSGRFN